MIIAALYWLTSGGTDSGGQCEFVAIVSTTVINMSARPIWGDYTYPVCEYTFQDPTSIPSSFYLITDIRETRDRTPSNLQCVHSDGCVPLLPANLLCDRSRFETLCFWSWNCRRPAAASSHIHMKSEIHLNCGLAMKPYTVIIDVQCHSQETNKDFPISWPSSRRLTFSPISAAIYGTLDCALIFMKWYDFASHRYFWLNLTHLDCWIKLCMKLKFRKFVYFFIWQIMLWDIICFHSELSPRS